MHRPLAMLVGIGLIAVVACSPAIVSTPSAQAPSASATQVPATPAPATPALTPVQDGTPVPSGAGPTGTLIVGQSSVADLPGVYTEGATGFVEVYDAAGTLVANGTNGDYLGAIELLRSDLPPGKYELRSYVRPCSGAGPCTDPPTDECRLDVAIEPGTEVLVRIVRSVGVPCRAAIAPA